MRRFIALLATILAIASFSAGAQSYRGSVDAQAGLGKIGVADLGGRQFYVELSTTHGVQISDRWFAGAGVAAMYPLDAKKVFFPVYADVKLRFPEFGKDVLYLDARGGVIPLTTLDEKKVRPYLSGGLGVELPFKMTVSGRLTWWKIPAGNSAFMATVGVGYLF